MLIKIQTAALYGVDGYPVTVETDLRRGMPDFSVVGLADATIREACRRIRPAIANSGFIFPSERVTVNLVPASRPKEGSHFDLPIAVSIVLLMEGIDAPDDTAILGEISLDGTVNPIRGALPLAISIRKAGIRNLILPERNAAEVAILKDIRLFAVRDLRQAVAHICGAEPLPRYRSSGSAVMPAVLSDEADFSQVLGQESVKRAMVISAAGNHGMLMMGSPGCGKTMMARRLPSILPPLTYEEQLEIMKVYSVAGLLPEGCGVISRRPFRNPHHSITLAGLIGGGARPRPGELSLANRGVLFLDELGEFDSRVLDGLRQPLEDGYVRIIRRQEEVVFPGNIMLVAAANPCKCGHLWDEKKQCTCTAAQLAGYRRKLSGPLSDRIDMHVRMIPVQQRELFAWTEGAAGDFHGTDSRAMRAQVEAARTIQHERYRGLAYRTNADLDASGTACFCEPDEEGKETMRAAFERMGLTMRGHHKILKIARTIADLEESEHIRQRHLEEALQYRPAVEKGGKQA